jgi:hypothetical protein
VGDRNDSMPPMGIGPLADRRDYHAAHIWDIKSVRQKHEHQRGPISFEELDDFAKIIPATLTGPPIHVLDTPWRCPCIEVVRNFWQIWPVLFDWLAITLKGI